jgi:hypothetical protein
MEKVRKHCSSSSWNTATDVASRSGSTSLLKTVLDIVVHCERTELHTTVLMAVVVYYGSASMPRMSSNTAINAGVV